MDRRAVAQVARAWRGSGPRSRSRSSSPARRPAPRRSAGRRRACRCRRRRWTPARGTSPSRGRSRCPRSRPRPPISSILASSCLRIGAGLYSPAGLACSSARLRSWRAACRGGAGRPSRTAPAAGSPTELATRFTGSEPSRSSSRALRHPDALEVGAEARLAGLDEGALELAPRGGHPAGDVVEGQEPRVLALDDLGRLLEQLAPALDRGLVAWRWRPSRSIIRSRAPIGSQRISLRRSARAEGAECRFGTG